MTQVWDKDRFLSLSHAHSMLINSPFTYGIVLSRFSSNSWCSLNLLFKNIETLQTRKLPVSLHVIIDCNAVCWHAMLAKKFTYLKLWVNWERKWKTSEVQNKQLMIGIINWSKENFTMRRNLCVNIYIKVKTYKERIPLCTYKKEYNWIKFSTTSNFINAQF